MHADTAGIYPVFKCVCEHSTLAHYIGKALMRPSRVSLYPDGRKLCRFTQGISDVAPKGLIKGLVSHMTLLFL